jgi:hypothetical protein
MDMISVRVRPSLEREEKAWFIGKDASRSVLRIGAVIIGIAFTTFFCILSYVNDVGNIINVIFGSLVLIKAITDFIRVKRYPQKHLKREQERVPDKVSHYTFGDDISTFEEHGTGSMVHSEYNYKVYKRAIHKDGWFILKFERNTIAFRDDEFEEGTPEQLVRLLREKIGDAFEEK